MSNRRYFKDVSNARQNGKVVHTDDTGIAEWFAEQARWEEVDAPAEEPKADKPKAPRNTKPKAEPKVEAKADDAPAEAK